MTPRVLLILTALGSHGAGLVVPQRVGGRSLVLGGAGVALGDLLEEVGRHEAAGSRARWHFLGVFEDIVSWWCIVARRCVGCAERSTEDRL